jgi:hypothetical protein
LADRQGYRRTAADHHHDINPMVGRERTERRLVDQVPAIRTGALERPGQVSEATIGGRIRVRVVYENGESGILSVAVANRLIQGEMQVPPKWLVQVLAAFFPGVPLAEVEYTDEFSGEAPRPDEDCFCALVPRV